MIVSKAHDEDKDKSCCECGLALDRLKNVKIDNLYYLSIGGNKVFICSDCLMSLYGRIGYRLSISPF